MPDPTPAAYRLFSWMRRGLLAGITDATGTGITSAPVAVVRGVFMIGVDPQFVRSSPRIQSQAQAP